MAERIIEALKTRMPPKDSVGTLMYLSRILFDYSQTHNDSLPNNLVELGKLDRAETIKTDIEYIAPNKKIVYDANNKFVPMAYDKSLLKKGQGTNVLFLDSHIEFVKSEALKKLGIVGPDSAHQQ
jgi:prepilin-type processing-associated H-X9-DG protein